MERIKITEQISYCPATEEPLSADVGFIRCGEEWWIYDVGSSTEAAAVHRVDSHRQLAGEAPLPRQAVPSPQPAGAHLLRQAVVELLIQGPARRRVQAKGQFHHGAPPTDTIKNFCSGSFNRTRWVYNSTINTARQEGGEGGICHE